MVPHAQLNALPVLITMSDVVLYLKRCKERALAAEGLVRPEVVGAALF